MVQSASSATAASATINRLAKTNDLEDEDSDIDLMKEEPPPSPMKKSRHRRFLSDAKNSLKRRLTSLSGFHTPVSFEPVIYPPKVSYDNIGKTRNDSSHSRTEEGK